MWSIADRPSNCASLPFYFQHLVFILVTSCFSTSFFCLKTFPQESRILIIGPINLPEGLASVSNQNCDIDSLQLICMHHNCLRSLASFKVQHCVSCVMFRVTSLNVFWCSYCQGIAKIYLWSNIKQKMTQFFSRREERKEHMIAFSRRNQIILYFELGLFCFHSLVQFKFRRYLPFMCLHQKKKNSAQNKKRISLALYMLKTILSKVDFQKDAHILAPYSSLFLKLFLTIWWQQCPAQCQRYFRSR